MTMAISARRRTDMGRLATDETLNKVVDAIKNSETVQAQKEEIRAEGVRVLATIPQDYKKTVEEVSSLKEDLYDVSKNLINNKAMVDGYYTTTTTEPTIKENTGLKCILVKIKGNTVYTLSSVSYSSVFYDANKQKIYALDKSNSALTFTSPSNSKYISISAYNEYVKTVMLVEGNTLPVEFENYKYENAMTIAKKSARTHGIN